jgi:hypothetical protein
LGIPKLQRLCAAKGSMLTRWVDPERQAHGPAQSGSRLASDQRHSSIAITYDRYGHLMPGSEAEAAGLLDADLREQTG